MLRSSSCCGEQKGACGISLSLLRPDVGVSISALKVPSLPEGGISFDMEKRGYERDLKLDLFATQRGCRRYRRDLRKSASKLLYRFNEGGARQGPLSGFAPQSCGLFDQTTLSAVPRQDLRLVLDNVGETAFKCFGNAGV